jgi:hypothetical protein
VRLRNACLWGETLLTRRDTFIGGLLVAFLSCASLSIVCDAQEPNDLDAFMARVLERRADNWKILRDYVLNEKEHVEVFAPGRKLLFGTQREYTWYLRDGTLVRSPVRFDGVAIGDAERKKYEETWSKEEGQREEREARRKAHQNQKSDAEDAPREPAAGDVTALMREAVEPRIVSQAYFMNFHFEPGNYYLAGRETLEGREILRIEYYPTHLFDEHDKHRDGPRKEPPGNHRDKDKEVEIERQLNKVALVTLWVDPHEYQIVKFTFDNMGFDFLPGRWLVRADDMSLSMVMGQPIKGVWLPREISGRGQVTLANGSYEIRYGREFFDYQQGEVRTKIRGFTPKDR